MKKKDTYVEVTVNVKRKPSVLSDRMEFSPIPDKIEFGGGMFPFPSSITLEGINTSLPEHQGTYDSIKNFIESLNGVAFNVKTGTKWKIVFKKIAGSSAEGYTLKIREAFAEIGSSGSAGLFYGAQTLIQILGCSYNAGLILGANRAAEELATEKKWIPELDISDAPAYKIRSFMVDAGRAPYTLPLLKRVVRIMAHLKLNTLHFHAFDDNLCGLRFNKLPLGSENPYAISMNDLSELVQYASRYHVNVMPELESWGHVQSIIYHYPETYGCPGMWGGMSFGVGQKTYNLLEKIYDEVVEILPSKAMLHVGMDEANWKVLKGEKGHHTPSNMVTRVYNLVKAAGLRYKKDIQVHLWADHGGRPLEESIRDNVVIEPWKYRHNDEKEIIGTMENYGGKGKTPCMMGAGWSSIHLQGSYEATRIWAREGVKYPNVLGITNCMWETNDLAGQMVGLYGGAAYSWNPSKPENTERDPLYEDVKCWMLRRMLHWQGYYTEANPDLINIDRGPFVMSGRYVSGQLIGKPVAPTLEWRINANHA